ncbi:MAG: putative sulfate/molybdate transporter [Syntrophales bacterium]|nr:putative sulfate/molybdate transporter [Syntrophales bacterium]
MNRREIRFDRHELAGSFGDIGTDLPLIVGIILASGMDACRTFIIFGLMQIITGLIYRLPMPMQPLKAMAVIIISQHLPESAIYGGGMAIGLIMLVLSLTGGLDWLAYLIPKPVIRGIQLGLGLSLAVLAVNSYIPAAGPTGHLMAFAGLVFMIALWGNERIPPGLIVIIIGIFLAFLTKDGGNLSVPTQANTFPLPVQLDIWTGLLLLALPQLPLSISNSVIATGHTINDLFPTRKVSFRKIGLTYSLTNIFASFLGGIPVCHGCGGLAGHYAFGGRTGGSVILYGAFYVIIGLMGGIILTRFVYDFPLPLLGVILLCEAATLCSLIHDQLTSKANLTLTILVGTVVLCFPYGYVIGITLGTFFYYVFNSMVDRYTTSTVVEKEPRLK